jgi:ABC-type multidrug transport system fused ATPase/permease subunit
MDKYDLRKQIALVQQDVFLFSGNVLDNIRLGNTQLKQEEVRPIVEAVNGHHFIHKLPDQYEQEIREGGNRLSLGQKQLISFARALAADPRILVLDEATSSIDPETEKHIQEAIQRLIRGRTSIIIAHRLSTLKYADKILVMKNGAIVEFGSPKELLKMKGVYHKLFSLQARQSSLQKENLS